MLELDFSPNGFQSNVVVLASPKGPHLMILDHASHRYQSVHKSSNLEEVSVTDRCCGINHFSTV